MHPSVIAGVERAALSTLVQRGDVLRPTAVETAFGTEDGAPVIAHAGVPCRVTGISGDERLGLDLVTILRTYRITVMASLDVRESDLMRVDGRVYRIQGAVESSPALKAVKALTALLEVNY